MKLITVIGILLVLVGVIFVLLSNIFPNGTPEIIFAHLGGIFIGAGFVELIFRFIIVTEWFKQVSSQFYKQINLPIKSFYESRNNLPPWKEYLENASEVWFAWHTGTVLGTSGINFILQNQKIIVRLILIHPNSNALNELEKIAKRSKNAMQQDIRELTKYALEKDIEVRWFDGPIGNSMIIINPESSSAWAQVELLVPNADTGVRPSLQVSKEKGEIAFKTFYDGYKSLWEKSKKPSLE